MPESRGARLRHQMALSLDFWPCRLSKLLNVDLVTRRVGGGLIRRWIFVDSNICARSVTSPVAWVIALCLLSGTLLANLWWAKPHFNWDLIGYVGVAYSFTSSDADSIHRATFADICAECPTDSYSVLTTGTDYRSAIAEDSGARFAQQLPFYASKPAYPALMLLGGKFGVLANGLEHSHFTGRLLSHRTPGVYLAESPLRSTACLCCSELSRIHAVRSGSGQAFDTGRPCHACDFAGQFFVDRSEASGTGGKRTCAFPFSCVRITRCSQSSSP